MAFASHSASVTGPFPSTQSGSRASQMLRGVTRFSNASLFLVAAVQPGDLAFQDRQPTPQFIIGFLIDDGTSSDIIPFACFLDFLLDSGELEGDPHPNDDRQARKPTHYGRVQRVKKWCESFRQPLHSSRAIEVEAKRKSGKAQNDYDSPQHKTMMRPARVVPGARREERG
jgi:hypothetical protein